MLPHFQTHPDLDHAVQLVGYGTDAKVREAWLSSIPACFAGMTSPMMWHSPSGMLTPVLSQCCQDGDYWLVRNSWSPMWGERGYIRLRRETTPRCGTDVTPDHGTGCKGGPPVLNPTLGPTLLVLFPIVFAGGAHWRLTRRWCPMRRRRKSAAPAASCLTTPFPSLGARRPSPLGPRCD